MPLHSKPLCPKKSQGIALYVVIFILVIIGLLTVQFHKFSRQAGATAFKLEQSEVGRQVAETFMDEAFSRIWKATENDSSTEAKFFIDRTPGATLDIALDTSKPQLSALFPDLAITATAKAGIYDAQDKWRNTANKFYGRECLGTMELNVDIKIVRSGKKVASCQMTRHHDFKVVSLLSKAANRAGKHAQNFILDYALFVRRAKDEFAANSLAYNNLTTKLYIEDQTSISAAQRGKIYLGGTDVQARTSDIAVFFNISDSFPDYQNLLPTFTPGPIATLAYAKWSVLLPATAQQIESTAKQKLDDEDDPDATAHAQAFVQAYKGIYEAEIVPAHRANLSSVSPLEQNAIFSVRKNMDPATPQSNTYPGVLFPARTTTLLSDSAYMNSIMQGAFRQRFLWLVKFWLDPTDVGSLPDCSPVPQADIDAAKAKAFPSGDATPTGFPNPTEYQTFVTGSKGFDTAGAYPNFVVSRYDEYFNYMGGEAFTKRDDSTSPKPSFAQGGDFARCPDGTTVKLADEITADSFRPYGVFPLRYRTLDKPDWMGFSDIYNTTTRKLKVRGISRIRTGKVVLGDGGAVAFSGKGVIIADDGFEIKSGIQKSDSASDDFVVLFTQKGNIKIETTDRIEAALIALGTSGTGKIEATQVFSVKGMVAVDILDSNNWAAGEHKIEYNPLFNQDKDLYQVLPAPHITYQRVLENVN